MIINNLNSNKSVIGVIKIKNIKNEYCYKNKNYEIFLDKLIECLKRYFMMNNINYLKERKIIMIYKGKGSIEKGENYRPIGLSNIFSKLINKILVKELNKY